MSSTFAADVRKFATKAETNGNQALRAICLELLNRVVLRSPVGNPDLWKANADPIYERKSARNFARDFGKRISRRKLQNQFPLKAGKTYVGGRFRGNWQVTVGAPATDALDRTDATGTASLADGGAVIANVEMGVVVFLVNNLPYAQSLEYGHSTQAPNGMVRITVAEFQAIVADAAKKL